MNRRWGRAPRLLAQPVLMLRDELDEWRFRVLSHDAIAGYARIYHVHVRKTGGTSLNHAFLALSGQSPEQLYEKLASHRNHRILARGRAYVGWNPRLIRRGNYFYAFSHVPLHALQLPENTFALTCLRDPLERVLSHYRMLLAYRQEGSRRADLREELTWLGSSLEDFLARIPKAALLNQLYMFSERFDVDEAYERISTCSQILFTEDLDAGIRELAHRLELPLQPRHSRRGSIVVDVSEQQRARLRDALDDEYRFREMVRRTSRA